MNGVLRRLNLTYDEIYDNANCDLSFSYVKEIVAHRIFSEITKDYYLKNIPKAIKYHEDGWIYIHDFWASAFIPYCAGWSLDKILNEGISFRNITAKPPKHLQSALSQIINAICVLQEEFAGAMAFNNFDLKLAPLIKKENLSYRRVKQCIQDFIWDCNYPTRSGAQSPFVNITLAMGVPKELEDQYGGLEKEIEMIDTAIFEELLSGDAKSRPFAFPIPTVNIHKDFDWDRDIVDKLMELAAKRGSPLFLTSDNKNLMAMCCRLNLDLDEMADYGQGLWSIGDSTGSIGVVTINLPRLALEYNDETQMCEKIDEIIDVSAGYLMEKRKACEKTLNSGLMEGTKYMLGSRGFKFHFNTIGIVGGHEFLLNSGYEKGILSADGREYLKKILIYIRERLKEKQIKHQVLYNLEQTPAETAAGKLARKDLKYQNANFGIRDSEGVEYTNSTHIPVDAEVSIFDKIRIEGELHKYFNGGCICHLFLNATPRPDVLKNFTKTIKQHSELVYFDYTPTMTVCKKGCGSFVGVYTKCLNCGSEDVEIYTRVVGYYSPVSNWNLAKKAEFRRRRRWQIE